jgi:predicted HTH domain antitoxin
MQEKNMSTVTIDLDEGLATLLHQTNENVELAASEMIVLELYRRGAISSGKAGELLGMPRPDLSATHHNSVSRTST